MAKKVIIKEEAEKRLFEAMMEGFSFDELSKIASYAGRVRYCRQYLGNPIGNGSSRTVFQIDDEKVLKLAKNRKGTAQNESEYEKGNDWYINHLFPNVFEGSDDKYYQWIVAEYVLPAKKEDFLHVLNMPFGDVTMFITSLVRNNTRLERELYQKYEEVENEDAVIFFNNLCDLYRGYDMLIQDFAWLGNWGIAKRDGETDIVALDAGCTQEIYNKFYR